MITKEKLLKHIDSFPVELTIDELIDRLIFVEKLEHRIELSKKNETISEKELQNETEEWFK